MIEPTSSEWGDSGLAALLRSPFLIPSILFHSLLFLLAPRRANLPIAKTEEAPITVQLVEVRDGGSSNKSIGSGSGPGGPRGVPKPGHPPTPNGRGGETPNRSE